MHMHHRQDEDETKKLCCALFFFLGLNCQYHVVNTNWCRQQTFHLIFQFDYFVALLPKEKPHINQRYSLATNRLHCVSMSVNCFANTRQIFVEKIILFSSIGATTNFLGLSN